MKANGSTRALWAYSFLLVLPALLVVAAGGWYVWDFDVPAKAKAEPARIARCYRDAAEDLAENPALGRAVAERPKGWRKVGAINRQPWGYVTDGEGTLVWWRPEEGKWLVRRVPTVRPVPYAAIYYGGGAALALVLFGLGGVAVFCLWRTFRLRERAMREREDFLRAAVHDLDTPVVGLNAMLELGERDEARTMARRLDVIVQNLKAFLMQGRLPPPKRAPFDLAALTREAYRLFAKDYEDSPSGAVRFDVDAAAAAAGAFRVVGDEARTLRALWNLFGNDLKYAAPHGPVFVRLSREGAFVCAAFADEGPGMSADERARAFDRYYRAKTVMETGKGGFGIGLCTARDSARAMGGDLTVRPHGSKGSVFTLSLPASP